MTDFFKNARYSPRVWRVLFLIPAGLFFIPFVLIPLASTFYFSFTDWDGVGTSYNIVFMDNFSRLIRDPLFRGALKNTGIWMAFAVVFPTVTGFTLALLLQGKSWGNRFFKGVFYLPMCLSAIIIGQIWIWIYHPGWGLLNNTLERLSLSGLQAAWLADPDTSLYAVMIAWGWQQTGLSMIIFLSGFTSIPRELKEAALIDRIPAVRIVFGIYLPLLKPSTIVVIALSVINSLKNFDIVYVMTGGGPFHTSETLAVFMYNESFRKYYMGYGSAISAVLFLITVSIIGVYFRQLKKIDDLYA